jgi:hypothetical protein
MTTILSSLREAFGVNRNSLVFMLPVAVFRRFERDDLIAPAPAKCPLTLTGHSPRAARAAASRHGTPAYASPHYNSFVSFML